MTSVLTVFGGLMVVFVGVALATVNPVLGGVFMCAGLVMGYLFDEGVISWHA